MHLSHARVIGGNPVPKLSWNCSGLQVYSYDDKGKVRLNLQWQAKRDEDRVCTCTAEQEVAGIQKVLIRTMVLCKNTICHYNNYN